MNHPLDQPKLLSIQYLRAVAALMIVGFHLLGPTGMVAASGVDIFFVISGFVIALVLRSPDLRASTFAYDRAARILPLYWLCTLILTAALLIVPQMFNRLHLTPQWLIQSLLMIPTFRPGTVEAFPVLYQGWTLNYEMFFYAVALLALAAPPARRPLVIAGILGICVALGPFRPIPHAISEVYTDPILLEFLAGFALVHMRDHGQRWGWRIGLALVASGVLGLALTAGSPVGPEGWSRLLLWGLPAWLIVAGAVTLEDARPLAGSRVLELLGAASYAIYLSHGLTIPALSAVVRRLLPAAIQPDDWLVLSGLFILAVLAGVVFHLAVERPLQAMLKRRRAR